MSGEPLLNNQNEMFNRAHEMQLMEKKKFMEDYGKELAQETDKRIREETNNKQQEKYYELLQAMNKKKEADMLNQQTLATKKNMQNLLAQEYENAMRLRKMQKEDERFQNLRAGKASVTKAQLELDYLRKAENDKKHMIKQILTSEKNAYDDRKKMQNQTQIMDVAESRKLLEDSELQARFKDYQNSQKYNHFNRFQEQVNQNYREQVFKPQLEKESKLNSIISKQEQDMKKRLEMDAQNRENAQKYWRMSNRATIEMQIKDKQSGRKVGETEFEVDMIKRLQHERNVNDVEFYEKFKKKQEQNQYKDMLDTQVKVSKQRRMYGNMTGVEKSLNKDDLVAWKNYDHTTYALIPGLNSSKKPISNKVIQDKVNHKRDRSFDEELHRMNQFGFTRDVTLARDPAYISHVAQSTRKLPPSHSLEPRRDLSVSRNSQNRSMAQVDYNSYSPSQPKDLNKSHAIPSREAPNRSLLRSGHRKYPNHHLYSNYNPISGAFYQTETISNPSIFKNAGSNIIN